MRLRAIDRTDRSEERLAAALKIYRETILPEAQNPEKQILYWIDHASDRENDSFCCFSIEKGSKVLGYLQYSYFGEEKVLFLEYLCVREIDSAGLRHSRAIESIRDHFARTYPADVTIVFEVAKTRTSADIWVTDERLKGYFLWLGFRSVAFDYQYPVLQSYDGKTSYPADLMVRLAGARTEITAGELRTILRCIYFKHYLRWDRPFLDRDQFSERERLINELYSRQIARIGSSTSFPTSGLSHRSKALSMGNITPRISALLKAIFGPKLPRLMGAALVVFAFSLVVGSPWALIPFVFLVLVIYCVAEDTASSRKLILALAARFNLSPHTL